MENIINLLSISVVVDAIICGVICCCCETSDDAAWVAADVIGAIDDKGTDSGDVTSMPADVVTVGAGSDDVMAADKPADVVDMDGRSLDANCDVTWGLLAMFLIDVAVSMPITVRLGVGWYGGGERADGWIVTGGL